MGESVTLVPALSGEIGSLARLYGCDCIDETSTTGGSVSDNGSDPGSAQILFDLSMQSSSMLIRFRQFFSRSSSALLVLCGVSLNIIGS